MGRSAACPFVRGVDGCLPLRAVLLFVHEGWSRSAMDTCPMAACSSRCGSAPTYATPRGEPSSRSAARTCAAYAVSSSGPTMRRQSLGSRACHAATSRAPKSTSLTGRSPAGSSSSTSSASSSSRRLRRMSHRTSMPCAWRAQRAHGGVRTACACACAKPRGRAGGAPQLLQFGRAQRR